MMLFNFQGSLPAAPRCKVFILPHSAPFCQALFSFLTGPRVCPRGQLYHITTRPPFCQHLFLFFSLFLPQLFPPPPQSRSASRFSRGRARAHIQQRTSLPDSIPLLSLIIRSICRICAAPLRICACSDVTHCCRALHRMVYS